jgi:hypothetical protein
MWLLRIKGGLEVTEAELGRWDNVPADAAIEALAFTIAREGALPYVLEYKGFERYCCARIATAAHGLRGLAVGYSIAVQQGGMVFAHDILANGMRFTARPEGRCGIPDRCWRRGT